MQNIFLFESTNNPLVRNNLNAFYLDEVERHPNSDVLSVIAAQLEEQFSFFTLQQEILKERALREYSIDLLNEAENAFFAFFKKVGEAIKLFFNKIWINIVSIFKSRIEYIKKYEEEIKNGYNEDSEFVVNTIDQKLMYGFMNAIEKYSLQTSGEYRMATPKLASNTATYYDNKGAEEIRINSTLIKKSGDYTTVDAGIKAVKEISTGINEYYSELDWEERELKLTMDTIMEAMNAINAQPKVISEIEKQIKAYDNAAKAGEKEAKESEKEVTAPKTESVNSYLYTSDSYLINELGGADGKSTAEIPFDQNEGKKKAAADEAKAKDEADAMKNAVKGGAESADKKTVDKTTVNRNRMKIVQLLQIMVNLQSQILKKQIDVTKRSNDKYWELIREAHKEYLRKKSKNEA